MSVAAGHPSGSSPYHVQVLLTDGSIATIRSVRPADREALYALHDHASDEAIRLRFFTVARPAAHHYVDVVCAPTTRTTALVVEQVGALLALGTAEPLGDGTAEVSFFVADSRHGHGVGTLLLEHLAAAARTSGVRRFVATVLATNTAMIRVFNDVGFETRLQRSSDTMTLTMETAATDRAVAAADARERRAEAASLRPLLHPRVVAVAGAGRRPASVGHAVLQNIVDAGFSGSVHVVNPGVREVAGVRAHPTVAALPEVPDLVVVAVPAPRVAAVLADAAEAGARAAVVLASGFRERGEAGRRAEWSLVEVARGHGMRVVGPNCLGIVSMAGRTRLDATFATVAPLPGRLAVGSQSGGVGIALLDASVRHRLGLCYFVSLGNKADVSGNDLLAAWADDPGVGAAALYLESFGNPVKFARLARYFAERKPLVVLGGGMTDSGRRAGLAHTARPAVPDSALSALCAHAGAIQARDLSELVDISRVVTTQPLPAGPRVGVIGNAAGLGVLVADAGLQHGLTTPELSPGLRHDIGERVGTGYGTLNPVDLGAGATPQMYESVIQAVCDADEVDMVLVVHVATRLADPDEVLAAADRALDLCGTAAAVVCIGAGSPPGVLPSRQVPVFSSVDGATAALGALARYAAWRHAPRGRRTAPAAGVVDRGREVVRELLDAEPAGRRLSYAESARLLDAVGISTVEVAVVDSADGAVGVAVRQPGPVVLKAADPRIRHKTEQGLVVTDVRGTRAVQAAFDRLVRLLPPGEGSVVVQPQVAAGLELAVGVVRHEGFGPLVMIAAGGVHADVWDDRTFLMPPVTDLDVARAMRRLRLWPLLAGHGGAPEADLQALEQLVLRVADVAWELPEVAELDLDPVVVGPDTIHCVDARLRVAPAEQREQPAARRLPDLV